MAPSTRRRRLGDLLTETGLITEAQLKAALNEQRKWGGRLGRTLVELGFATETAISRVLAAQLELPAIDLDTADLPEVAPTWLRLDLCERYGVFPVGLEPGAHTLKVATSDPTNLEHLQALEFATNLKVSPTVATASAIDRAIRRYYFGEAVGSAPRPPPLPAAQPPPPPADAGGISSTSYELDALLGEPPAPSREHRALQAPELKADAEAQLRREVSVLREQVSSLEEINSAQVRALRVLLELLIESGLVTREEYLEKLHSPE